MESYDLFLRVIFLGNKIAEKNKKTEHSGKTWFYSILSRDKNLGLLTYKNNILFTDMDIEEAMEIIKSKYYNGETITLEEDKINNYDEEKEAKYLEEYNKKNLYEIFNIPKDIKFTAIIDLDFTKSKFIKYTLEENMGSREIILNSIKDEKDRKKIDDFLGDSKCLIEYNENESIIADIFERTKNYQLNATAIEFLLGLMDGLTSKHDLHENKISKIIIKDNDDNITLFIQNFSIKNNTKKIYLLLQDKMQPWLVGQISEIFEKEAYNLTTFKSESALDINKEIEAKEGLEVLNYIKLKQDQIDLINFAQKSTDMNFKRRDYSTKIVGAGFWMRVVDIFGYTQIKSIDVKTEKNYLMISKKQTKKFILLHLLNLNNKINSENYTKICNIIEDKVK